MSLQAAGVIHHRLVRLRLAFASAALAAITVGAQAQSVSVYQEDNKLIRAPRSVTRLGDDLFGDKVSLYTGTLEFVQNDVAIPGNSALPVSVGRRLLTGRYTTNVGLFGNWDLEIPHLHGMFTQAAGWVTLYGTDRNARCSAYGPPPTVGGTYGAGSAWSAVEYWQGNFLYVPGVGDQEMLQRAAGHLSAPGSNPPLYPLVTRNNWAIRCLPALDAGNGAPGEGFIAVSPDGTQYRFDWLVSLPQGTLEKGTSSASYQRVAPESLASIAPAPVPAPDDATPVPASTIPADPGESPNLNQGTYSLERADVWILPTSVTDRFGNVVTYSYDPVNKRRLNSITSNEVGASARTISFTYGIPGKDVITSMVAAGKTWTFNYDLLNLDTVTLVTMQNTGNTTWPAGSNYKLGSKNPDENLIWGVQRVDLANDVAPGQQYTFTFAITAPAAGTYTMQWEMMQRYVQWFGGIASGSITVSPPGPVESVTYIHTDALGSPVARTDSAGAIISRTSYEPYGRTAGGVTPTIGFTGHVNDADTGLVYMQQRYYDPVAGRFLSIDPVITDADTGGSFNRYAYANNSPYRYVDRDGRNGSDPFADPPIATLPAPQIPIVLPPLPGLPPVGTIGPPIIVTVPGVKISEAFNAWKLRTTLNEIYGFGRGFVLDSLRLATAPILSLVEGIKQASRPSGAVDAIRGAREWGKRNGIDPDRAVDIFHGIKGGNRGQPGCGPQDNCSVNPESGEIFNGHGDEMGNLNDGH